KILLLNLQTKHKLKSWALYLMRRYSSPSTQAAGKHSEDDGTISIYQLPHRHLSREHSEKRERERETLWMIMIITKVETVTGRGLSIEKERRGTGPGHALARAAALNNSGGQQDGWRLQESCLRYHHNA
ncbi:unnamed protein product, partial [Brassica oleracea]